MMFTLGMGGWIIVKYNGMGGISVVVGVQFWVCME